MKCILLVMVLMVPAIHASAADANLEARQQLNALIQEEWEYALRQHPELATFVGDSRYTTS